MQERPYEIVDDMNLEGLTAKVNALVARGYRPIGCLLRVPAVGYRQAMWKEPREIAIEKTLAAIERTPCKAA
jgi:hypothetical protein